MTFEMINRINKKKKIVLHAKKNRYVVTYIDISDIYSQYNFSTKKNNAGHEKL